MKYLVILMVLLPMVVFAQPTPPNPPAPPHYTGKLNPNPNPNLGADPNPNPNPNLATISLTCEQAGAVAKTKCSSSDIQIFGIEGTIPISVTNPKGQCCIPKSKLRIR